MVLIWKLVVGMHDILYIGEISYRLILACRSYIWYILVYVLFVFI